MEKFTIDFPPMDEETRLSDAFGVSPERDAEITEHMRSSPAFDKKDINIAEVVNHAVEIATSYKEAYYIIMKSSFGLGRSIERSQSRRNPLAELLGMISSKDESPDDDDDDDVVPSFFTGKA